jgi:hypothetical protein
MKKLKFPKLIHVRVEEFENDETALVIAGDGVMAVDETQPMAIYKLVEVGQAVVTRTFRSKRS